MSTAKKSIQFMSCYRLPAYVIPKDTMAKRIFERPVDLAKEACKRLHGDSETADVRFVFNADTGNPVQIHAHKCILSANSSVFRTMFYGSMKEQDDIEMIDTSPDAFTEFLQFFYLDGVHLTSDHIIEVAYLCKKYALPKGLKLCELPLQSSLIDDIKNICSNYKAILLLEMENVVKAVETAITNNAQRVLQSPSYFDCDCGTLKRILQLISTRCSAPQIVDACIEWAKAKCEQNDLPKTSINFRDQLNPVMDSIPFDKLSAEQFSQYAANEFFRLNDLRKIVLKTLSKNRDQPERSSESPAIVLDCNRAEEDNSLEVFIAAEKPYKSSFSANTKLLLTEFYIAETSLSWDFTCLAVVSRGDKSIISQRVTLVPGIATHVILSQPVLIDADVVYAINLDISMQKIFFKRCPYRNVVKIKDGIKVKFCMSSDAIVGRLKFQQPIS